MPNKINLILLLVLLPLFGLFTGESHGNEMVQVDLQSESDWIGEKLGDGLNARDRIASQVVAEEFSRQISSVEWLAPLAPVALSPFFGITLLSGLACYGPDWLPDNALLSEGSPLANPVLFWVFLVLTVVTSLPRFLKVSKPIAQLADFFETYSAILILLILKFVSMQDSAAAAADNIVQAGILSFGWEGILMVAMAINVFVVNSVKFFFEFLVWITPIPFLDACFEIANKFICASLIAIYAYNPIVALILNILIFTACAFVFRWIRRREIFYRNVLFDLVLKIVGSTGDRTPSKLLVFPKQAIGSIPARAKCSFEKTDEGWKLMHHRMLRSALVESLHGQAELDAGWWTNSIVFENGKKLTFGSRFNQNLNSVADELNLRLIQQEVADAETRRQIEFA